MGDAFSYARSALCASGVPLSSGGLARLRQQRAVATVVLFMRFSAQTRWLVVVETPREAVNRPVSANRLLRHHHEYDEIDINMEKMASRGGGRVAEWLP